VEFISPCKDQRFEPIVQFTTRTDRVPVAASL